MKYKVGDGVRVLNGLKSVLFNVGDITTVLDVIPYSSYNLYLIEHPCGDNLQVRETDIELYKSNTPDKPKIDPIVTSVMTQLLTRSQLGINKYGTTLQDNNNDDFLQHLKEELMDAILYIEKKQTQENERRNN